MNDLNITQRVATGFNDDELLPITKCVCGKRFKYWDFTIGLGRESAAKCPSCGHMLYFELTIQIYERTLNVGDGER